jgi:putative ABC transport system substrate-binding protein
MKRIAAMLMSLMMVLSLAACGGSGASQSVSSESASQSASETPSQSDSQSVSASGEVLKIGVIQLMEHSSLDEAYQGFVDGLADAGYVDGENISIDYQNAQGEQANCQTIAEKLVADQCDLILAIATPAAQAMANATTEIPILVTAVTDPADAKLVESNEKPGGNVTGTSDLTPVAEQIKLLKELVPDAKTVGLLYNSGEANSKYQMDIARETCESLGLETVDLTVSSTNEIQQVVESAVGKVDALYTPSDNVIASAVPNVVMVSDPAGIPFIVGVEAMVETGGLATYGINYYNLGKLTATQAVDILEGKSVPADMPIQYLSDCTLVIDQEKAAALGITIPQELLDQLAE